MRSARRHTAVLLAGTIVATGYGPKVVQAQSAKPTELDTITITATRTEEAAVDSLASVSVVTDGTVKQTEAGTVAELLQAVPGVSVEQSADSTGSAINIRGLQDFGRVAVTIDGARQNYQVTGHGLNGGAYFFEPEFLDTVTVVRGPVANLYGSGAIGGLVSFETKRPSTFLDSDEIWATETFSQYNTNNGFALGATGARRFSDTVAALASVVYRKNWQYQDGNGEDIFNSGNEILSGMVKTEITPIDGQSITIGAITNNSEFTGGDPGGTLYDNVVSDNTVTANFSFEMPENDWLDVSTNVYWTGTDVDQTQKNRSLAGNKRSYNINTVGADAVNTSRFSTGSFDHQLTIGADLFYDSVEVTDERGTFDLFTPTGNRGVYGAFVQNAVSYSDWLDVIGAVRFDGYWLDGGDTSVSGSRLSPKLTVGISPFERTAFHGIQFYSTYAEGYRAPTITETLISGIHPFPSFDFLPNPDLKPETARTIEAGINVSRDDVFTQGDSLRLKGAVFRNDVEDFIGFVQIPGTGSPPFFIDDYQYQNFAKARIEGIELEANYDMGWMFVGLAGQHQTGEDRDTGAPLDSIPANKLVSTLGFRAFDEKAVFGVQWEAVAAQDDVTDPDLASEAYNLVNLFASYEPRENLILGLNVDNVFNEQYTPFLDSDPAPGTSVKFTLRTRLGG